MLLADVGQGDLIITMFWLFIRMLWFWLLIKTTNLGVSPEGEVLTRRSGRGWVERHQRGCPLG